MQWYIKGRIKASKGPLLGHGPQFGDHCFKEKGFQGLLQSEQNRRWLDKLGQGVPEDGRGLGKVLKARMGGGGKGATEQEVLGGMKKTI
ncbi:unnamed protein product [Staurois parvus]|uniref:Uncharacterized protein n=1 Tax=Staurois parvus TaxID=386267 RepID=A0ABN9ELV6_9NEOB|nr:unnamed protein product [Staurois parvus]